MQNELSLQKIQPKQTIPCWNVAQHYVFPLLEPITINKGNKPDVLASTFFDPLSAMLTSGIKMTLALFYQGAIVPLSEMILREWSITFATVRLAMEHNLAVLGSSSRLEHHTRTSLSYWSLHTQIPLFNSVLPFFNSFRESLTNILGNPFYFSVPNRRTVILFKKETLSLYTSELKRDLLLEFECSTNPLSPELLEVSQSGVLTIGHL